MKPRLLGMSIGLFVVFSFIQVHAQSAIDTFQTLTHLMADEQAVYCTPVPDNYSPLDKSWVIRQGQNQSLISDMQLKETALFLRDNRYKTHPLPSLNIEQAYFEAARLKTLLRKSVPHAVFYSDKASEKWVGLAKRAIIRSGIYLNRAQVLVVVDRNPKIQALSFILAFPENGGEWQVIGGEHVSTGTQGRRLYYKTPVGVFTNTTERIGYRALGTKNKYGIRGNGGKGMRVWDFGWQWAEKGWLPNHVRGQIRLEMHATDPVYLEPRLGHAASEGCVRISAAMNHFIDYYGLIDALYNQAAFQDRRFQAILLKKRQSSPLAGYLLVVVDSSLS